MAHDHSHAHGSHEHPLPETLNRAFLIALVANGLFTFFQVGFALFAHSSSLLADAIHNAGDVLSLAFAFVANRLLTRAPTVKSTYGMKKTSILAAWVNGLLLVFSSGIIVADAVSKFFHPTAVHALSVMLVAGVGIAVNGSTARLFMGSSDLNVRGAYLHLFYDALISAGVVLAAALLYITGWLWIDPLMGLLIAGIILRGTWALFADSFRLMIDAVPKTISFNTIRDLLLAEPGVKQVHDLHIWALSTRENALSAHLWIPEQSLSDAARQRLVHVLHTEYHIHHVTLQVENDLAFCEEACKLE